MFRIALLLCVAYAHGSVIPDIVPRFRLFGDERIVGGSPIEISDAPYQVSFQRYNNHMCGGSIISEYHVLTAAHCSIVDPNPAHLLIGSGSENLRSVQMHDVAANTHHSSYNRVTIDYDVAVLRVATPFVFGTTTRPVALATTEPADDEPVIVSGWGALKSGGSVTGSLNAVQVNIINRAVCEKAYNGFNGITARMICAGQLTGGKDSCQGDSGGPMVSQKTNSLVGIVSWGYGCARPNYPGVYTDVSNVAIQEFIQAQLKQ